MTNDKQLLTDNLICGFCKGKKIVINEVTKTPEICPHCHGTGKLKFEQKSEKKGLLLG